MRTWLANAKKAEVEKLVKAAKTSLGNLRQIAGGYRTEGVARTTPEVARLIDIATHKLAREGLPPILREELCPACSQCEYQKLCKEKQNG
jgi:hypothetical protein